MQNIGLLTILFYSFYRVKRTERIFVHKNLLFSLGLGNLVYILDIASFSSRMDHIVSCLKFLWFKFLKFLIFKGLYWKISLRWHIQH